MNHDGFCDRSKYIVPRIERFVRILKNHLQILSELEECAALQRGDVDSLEIDLSFGRILEPRNKPTRRRLPAAGFPHEAENFPRMQIEADPIHRTDLNRVPSE